MLPESKYKTLFEMLDSQEIHKPYKITFENGRVIAIEADPSGEIKTPAWFDPESCVTFGNYGVFRMPDRPRKPETFDTDGVKGFLDGIEVKRDG